MDYSFYRFSSSYHRRFSVQIRNPVLSAFSSDTRAQRPRRSGRYASSTILLSIYFDAIKFRRFRRFRNIHFESNNIEYGYTLFVLFLWLCFVYFIFRIFLKSRSNSFSNAIEYRLNRLSSCARAVWKATNVFFFYYPPRQPTISCVFCVGFLCVSDKRKTRFAVKLDRPPVATYITENVFPIFSYNDTRTCFNYGSKRQKASVSSYFVFLRNILSVWSKRSVYLFIHFFSPKEIRRVPRPSARGAAHTTFSVLDPLVTPFFPSLSSYLACFGRQVFGTEKRFYFCFYDNRDFFVFFFLRTTRIGKRYCFYLHVYVPGSVGEGKGVGGRENKKKKNVFLFLRANATGSDEAGARKRKNGISPRFDRWSNAEKAKRRLACVFGLVKRKRY